MENKYPIKKEWEEYYKTLEAIRRTGVCNMWGAGIYLKECFPDQLSEQAANDVLINWIYNYKELNQKYSWQECTEK